VGAFKLQVQDDDKRPDYWHDVNTDLGTPYLFTKEADARAKLLELFPILVKMEQFRADFKRTRVVVVNPYDDIDNPEKY